MEKVENRGQKREEKGTQDCKRKRRDGKNQREWMKTGHDETEETREQNSKPKSEKDDDRKDGKR